MAISADLSKFKAPGVKLLTKVNDNPPQATPPSGARVLVINSRKGPVNNPYLIQDYQNDYLSTFDGQSQADFRKGNFGALAAEEMLQVSPIWVLNLRSFDDELDKLGKVKLDCDSDVENSTNGVVEDKPYTEIHSTNQFWTVDPNKLIPNNSKHDTLLNIANVGSTDLSIVVRKTQTSQRDITFEQWYSNLDREMPPYVNPTDKIADWMVDVVVFDNTFNMDSKSNSKYGYCFDEDGFIKKQVYSEERGSIVDGVEELKNIPSSGYISTITGSLVENFTDETGNNLDVVKLINQSIQRLGLVAKLDEEIYDDASIWVSDNTNKSDGNKKPTPVDFLGHKLFHVDGEGYIDEDPFYLEDELKSLTLDNVSYKKNYKLGNFEIGNKTFDENPKPEPKQLINKHNAFLVGDTDSNDEMVKPDSLNELVVISGMGLDIGSKYAGVDGNLSTVTDMGYIGKTKKVWGVGKMDTPIIPFNTNDYPDGEGADTGFSYVNSGDVFPKDQTIDAFVYPTTHPLAGEPLAFDSASGNVVHNPNDADSESYLWQKGVNGQNLKVDFASLDTYTAGTETLIEFSDISPNNYDEQDLVDFVDSNGVEENVFKVKFDKPLGFSQDPQTTIDNDISFDVETSTISILDGTEYPIYRNNLSVYKVEDFDYFVDSYQPFSISSYTARAEQFLNGTFDRQEEVLSILTEKSMLKSLSNRKLIQWNYIVDGFKSYVSPNVKYQLKQVAQKRVTARAICNMPSVDDFSNSNDPYFSDVIGGNLDAKYIPQGGNRKLPHNNIFSLPSSDGWFAYFYGPNLKMSTGRTFPPAATVSNSFALKYENSKPYVIVAGEDDGLLLSRKATGIEYMFSESNDGDGDLDYLYPFGYNAITTTEIGGDMQIFGNHTAYNTVSSPMGAIHTSEVVMYIQEQINSLLKRYVFKYNTANNRLRIREEADSICQPAQDAGAISNFSNKMDTENNTEEVRNNRIGILDTRLVDSNGMEILVHRTTIDGENNSASFEIM